MLLDVPYKQNDIISLKLTSGEEVIGRFENESSTAVVVAKAMSLSINQQGVGLTPYMFSVDLDNSFKINTSHIISIVKTTKEIASAYMQQTSGLTL